MRRFNIAYTLGCIALAAFTLQGCLPKTTNLDNLNVITKPYSLHFADSAGLVYSTYDGEQFNVFNTTQGTDLEFIMTSGDNLFIKFWGNSKLFVAERDGDYVTFNVLLEPELNPEAFGPTQVINLPGYATYPTGYKQDRIYAAAVNGKGIAYQDYHGHIDSNWYYPQDEALGTTSTRVTSFAHQPGGQLFAFDNKTRSLYVKPAFDQFWQLVQSTGLPAAGTGQMFILTQRNDLLAVMLDGGTDYGVWRSSDNGANFFKLPDITSGGEIVKDITCAVAPFGKVLVVGTKSHGIWRLSGQGVWEPGSIGLKHGVAINGIVAKDNVFKNERKGEYLFTATNDGLYRSDDMGQTWVRLEVPSVKPNFTVIH